MKTRAEEDWVDRLLAHLDKKGFTQQLLADRLGMTYQGVNHWKTRRRTPQFKKFPKIAAAAECSIVWLLAGIGPEDPITNEDLILATVISRLPPGDKTAATTLLNSLINRGDGDIHAGRRG